jgi:alkylation response protein AidB-like acyl-CoA dehydrogenase
MDLEAGEQTRLIQSQVDEFISQVISPLEEEYDEFVGEGAEANVVDEDGKLVDEYVEITERIRKKSAEAGFFTMQIPEDIGGGGLSTLEFLQVIEHIYDRDPRRFHHLMLSPNSTAISLYDDEYQRETYFEPWMDGDIELSLGLTEPDHGNDATWMDTVAEKDGNEWVINGTKCFITNSAIADTIIVIARTSGSDGSVKGLSAFVIADNPGWEVGKLQRPMGGLEVGLGALAFNHFNDCRVLEEQLVGEEGQGLIDIAFNNTINEARLRIPAKAVGQASWMFEQCVDYAETRNTFGEPIGSRQFVKGMLADMRMDTEQVRWLYRKTAWDIDHGTSDRWQQRAAKVRGAELWNDAADIAVQIHGGAGYMESLPFEETYRNARVAKIYDGTDEVHRAAIADHFLSLD